MNFIRTSVASIKSVFTVLAASALILTGCGRSAAPAASDSASPSASLAPAAAASVTEPASPAPAESLKLKVVASFYPMYEFARQVGGDHAEVTALIGGGVEPHEWEPTPKDVAAIQEADLFLYNGIVESWADKVIQSTASGKRTVVQANSGITLMQGVQGVQEEEGEEADPSGLDPHVWLSPLMAQKEVQNIADAYEKVDPANKDDYQKNADAYIAKLKELDEAYKTGLKDSKRKDFITQHAAFAYLAKDYGLKQVPIAGLSPEEEPSPEKMAEIVKFAKQNNVKTIFFETLVDPKIAETIAKEIGAKTDVLNPIEGLTAEDAQKGLDYIGVMKNNLEALKKALNE